MAQVTCCLTQHLCVPHVCMSLTRIACCHLMRDMRTPSVPLSSYKVHFFEFTTKAVQRTVRDEIEELGRASTHRDVLNVHTERRLILHTGREGSGGQRQFCLPKMPT